MILLLFILFSTVIFQFLMSNLLLHKNVLCNVIFKSLQLHNLKSQLIVVKKIIITTIYHNAFTEK
jgi:hypothetical protein